MSLQDFMDAMQSFQVRQQEQIDLLNNNVNSLAKSVSHLTEAQEINMDIPKGNASSRGSPVKTRSDIAYERGSTQQNTQPVQSQQGPPLPMHPPAKKYQMQDPRAPLSKWGVNTTTYHTCLWYLQDNWNYDRANGPRPNDAVLAQAKWFKFYPAKAIPNSSVDDQIDMFEKWFNTTAGNPYLPGLDHEVLRLFASACENIPKLAKAFDNYMDLGLDSPTWAAAVHHLHMKLTTHKEREGYSREDKLEGCKQGNDDIITFNNQFNHTLQMMQRHDHDMLATHANRVVIIYLRNLNLHFHNHLDSLANTGMTYDTHEHAHHNIYAIQTFMECLGEHDRQNQIENHDEADLSGIETTLDKNNSDPPTWSLDTSRTTQPSPFFPADSSSDVEMLDLIRDLDNMGLSDSQQVSILHTIQKDCNQIRAAGAPRIHLASASESPTMVSSIPAKTQYTMPAPLDPTLPSHATPRAYPGNNHVQKDYSTYRCNLCGKMGHIAVVCPAKTQNLVCTNCEGRGHYSSLCPLEPGPRILWMRRHDEYQLRALRPFFNDEDDGDDFSEHDYAMWEQEKAIYQVKAEQHEDFIRG